MPMRRILQILKLLLVLIACITLLCCKKEASRYYLSDEMKQWTVFKMGSYWIYKNEVSNKIDSAYIDQLPFNNIQNLPKIHDDELFYQKITFHMQCPFYHTYIVYTRMSDEYLEISTKFEQIPILIYDKKDGFDISELIPEFKLNNPTFHNVIHATSYKYTFYPSDTLIENTYFAKNVGIIKYSQKTTKSDTTWTLLNYRTLQ